MAKPTLQDLGQHLQDSVTVILSERIKALRGVASWYSEMKAFARIDRAGMKWYDRGEKARTLGFGGTTLDEQEAGLLNAIRFYEKAYANAGIRTLAFEDFKKQLEAKRGKLEAGVAKLRKQFEPVLSLVEEAFAPFGLTFLVSDSADVSARGFDENGNIVFSKDHAKKMLDLVRTGSGVKVLMEEFPTVVKAQAIDRDALGASTVNSAKLMSGLDRVAQVLHDYLLRAGAKAQAKAKAKAPVPIAVKTIAPRRPKRNRKRGRTYYRKGSIMEQLLTKLKTGNGETTMGKLFQGIKAADPDRFIRIMVKDGEENGLWALRKERGGSVFFEEKK